MILNKINLYIKIKYDFINKTLYLNNTSDNVNNN